MLGKAGKQSGGQRGRWLNGLKRKIRERSEVPGLGNPQPGKAENLGKLLLKFRGNPGVCDGPNEGSPRIKGPVGLLAAEGR